MASKQNRDLTIGIQTPVWPHHYFPNGITKYVASVSKELGSLGVSVTILANQLIANNTNNARLIDLNLKKADLSIFSKLYRKYLPRTYKDYRLTKAFSDLVARDDFRHLNLVEMTDSFGYAKTLKKMVDIPVIVRLHGPWFIVGTELGVAKDDKFWERVKKEGEGIACADAISAPSLDVLERTRQHYNFPLSNAEVIPTPAPKISRDEAWNLDDCDKQLLLFVGRFDRVKGGDLVIDSFIELKKTYSDIELIFIGPDRGLIDDNGKSIGLREYIMSKSPNKHTLDSIHCKGELDYNEIPPYRKRAMVTLVASRYETFGNVVLEALMYGSPSVVSNSGGMPEIVDHGRTGLLFKSGCVDDLTEKIATLLNSPDYAKSIGENALKDIQNRFSGSKIAQKNIDFYNRVIIGCSPKYRGSPNTHLPSS